MRKCQIEVGVEVPGRSPSWVDATFHQFGTTEKHTEGKDRFPVTVAIVELADGSVRKIDPASVKFTDLPSAETGQRVGASFEEMAGRAMRSMDARKADEEI